MMDAYEHWQQVRPILLPFSGAASQVYVLDLPIHTLGPVLDRFTAFVTEPTVDTLDGYTGTPAPFTADQRATLLACRSENPHHILGGLYSDTAKVMLWIWIDSQAATFDAEVVLWADQIFPDPTDDPACIREFARFVALVESFRELSPTASCIITDRETGDPREFIGQPGTYSW
jgi:hypothetical protein